jgi:phosphoketolase
VINGLPIWQTVTQAMTELRRPTPSTITLFTAGALEQGRNGWTHQRPEVENYFASMMRNGNVFPYFLVMQIAFKYVMNGLYKPLIKGSQLLLVNLPYQY